MKKDVLFFVSNEWNGVFKEDKIDHDDVGDPPKLVYGPRDELGREIGQVIKFPKHEPGKANP
jgi:hypothetical protein